MKKFLLSCALMLVGLPVGATEIYEPLNAGDVFYCVTTAFASSNENTDWELRQYSQEKFKLQIAKDEITIKNDNWFSPENKYKSIMYGVNVIEGKGSGTNVLLRTENITSSNGVPDESQRGKAKLVYTFTGIRGFYAMTADCDKF